MAKALYVPPEAGPAQSQNRIQGQGGGGSPAAQGHSHSDNQSAGGQGQNGNQPAQDNQPVATSELPDVVQTPAPVSAVISSHVTTGSHHPGNLILESGETAAADSTFYDHVGPTPLSPRSNQYPVTVHFEFGLKINNFGCERAEVGACDGRSEDPLMKEYRDFGRLMREQIADKMDKRSFEMNLALKIVFPAAFLFGLGFAYFNKVK